MYRSVKILYIQKKARKKIVFYYSIFYYLLLFFIIGIITAYRSITISIFIIKHKRLYFININKKITVTKLILLFIDTDQAIEISCSDDLLKFVLPVCSSTFRVVPFSRNGEKYLYLFILSFAFICLLSLDCT